MNRTKLFIYFYRNKQHHRGLNPQSSVSSVEILVLQSLVRNNNATTNDSNYIILNVSKHNCFPWHQISDEKWIHCTSGLDGTCDTWVNKKHTHVPRNDRSLISAHFFCAYYATMSCHRALFNLCWQWKQFCFITPSATFSQNLIWGG